MRYDVNEVWDQWQDKLFADQEAFEQEALDLYRKGDYKDLYETLTGYTMKWGNLVVDKAWELGDMLWTKYDEMF
jgi:hypothetical protein